MDIREKELDPETVDQLALRKIDPTANLELDIARKGDRTMFLATISKELISYMACIEHTKSNYAAKRRAEQGVLFQHFFHKSS